jgi:FKBP-type peptidyl-prolyl cis-trans isomerase FkpA
MNFKFLIFALVSVSILFSCKDKKTRTESGYDFRFVTKGSGEEAKEDSYVYFTLKIVDENGKVLQSMDEGPNMPIMYLPKDTAKNETPNPVLDVLKETRVGDVVVLVMPVDSIPNAPKDIAGMKFIEYEMTIKNVTDKAGYEKYMGEMEEKIKNERMASMEKLPAIEELVKNTIKDYNSNTLKTESTASGLKYYIVEQGTGETAKDGQTVSVQYYGALKNGNQFDNSFTRGQAFSVPVGAGQVIKGWDEGLKLLNKGTKAFLFIPAELGYGAEDSPQIPANSELIFYIEMEDIK